MNDTDTPSSTGVIPADAFIPGHDRDEVNGDRHLTGWAAESAARALSGFGEQGADARVLAALTAARAWADGSGDADACREAAFEAQLAACVGEFDHGIHRGIEPPRENFCNDRVARIAAELENVPVVLLVNTPVHNDGQSHLLHTFRGVIGFLVKNLRQRVQGKRHGIGEESVFVRNDLMNARLSVFGGQCQLGIAQMQASHFDRDRIAHPATQREDARNERRLTDGDAIDKILTTSENGVIDDQHIFAVLGIL